MAAAVRQFSLERYKQAPVVFCPFGYADWHRVVEPEVAFEFGERTYAIHLWNERWRAAGQDKNGAYAEGCLYERLKRRYLAVYPTLKAMPLAGSA